VFRGQWENSVLPIQEDSSKGMLFTSYITWTIISGILYLFNWCSRGRLARYSLAHFDQHRWLAAILAPLNKEKVSRIGSEDLQQPSTSATAGTLRKRAASYGNRPRFWLERWALSYKRKWRLTFSVRFRFIVHLLSYAMFLALISFIAFTETTPELQKADFALALWIVGLALVEAEQLKHRGLSEHFRDGFNKIDAAHVLTYALILAAKFAAAFISQPRVVSVLLGYYDAMFACVLIVSYTRTLYALLAFRSVGPLLIVVGRMMGDVVRFLCLASVVLAGFAFSLFKLFRGVAIPGGIASSSSSSSGDGQQRNLIVHAAEASSAVGAGDSFLRTLAGLYFAIVGSADLDLGSGYREILGNVLVGVFMVTTTIVLVNLLIAMMSSSFQKVEAQSDIEWKARFAQLVTDFGTTSVVPAPLNIVSWAVWLIVNPFARCVLGCQMLCCLGRRKRIVSLDESDGGDDGRGSKFMIGRKSKSGEIEEQESALLDDSRDGDYVDEAKEEEDEDEGEGDITMDLTEEVKGLEEETAEHEREEMEREEAVAASEHRYFSDSSFGRYVQGLSRELFQEGLEAEASVRNSAAAMFVSVSSSQEKNASKRSLHRHQSRRVSVSVRRPAAQQPLFSAAPATAAPVATAPAALLQNPALLAETKDMLKEAVSQLLVEWSLVPATSPSTSAAAVHRQTKKK
jgi:hypothetical protein